MIEKPIESLQRVLFEIKYTSAKFQTKLIRPVQVLPFP